MENYSVNQVKEELLQIRRQIDSLMLTLQRLEAKVGGVPEAKKSVASVSEVKIQPALIKQQEKKQKSGNIEIDMGRFWLSRIGIIVFALGIGFLISYVFKSFGPLAKIMFGYLVSVGLFFAGLRFEKNEKFVNYGRVLLGGAWAITYFTTYAMYHFEASRIISSQLLDLLLLSVVAGGIIWHSLRYRSEQLCSIAILVGYLTATLGAVNYFTMLSCLVLAVTSVFLLYRMQWVKLIYLGILLTYSVHFYWVYGHIYNYSIVFKGLSVDRAYFLLNGGFLFMYWSVFILATHLIKLNQDEKIMRRISSANFLNFLLFYFMAFGELSRLYPDQRFNFMFGFGVIYLFLALVMEKFKSTSLFTSNILVALSLLTLSIPLKFIPFHTSLIWMIELPFLIFIGVVLDRKVFRYFGNILLIVLFIKVYLFDSNTQGPVRIFSHVFSWDKFISLVGFISASACFYILKYSKNVKSMVCSSLEKPLFNLSSLLASIYLLIFLSLVIDSRWFTPALSLESLLIFLVGYLLSDRPLRFYALFGILIVFSRYCLFDSYELAHYKLRAVVLIMEAAPLYVIYFIYRYMRAQKALIAGEAILLNPLFYLTNFLTTLIICNYVPSQWISLGLGLEGISLFILGFLFSDKHFRIAGFIVFALTLLRILFIDLAMLAVIYKIASFIILGLIFLAVSFIYTKYNIKKSGE